MPAATIDPNQRAEPRLGYGYAIVLEGSVQGWFTQCSDITIEREVQAYSEGGVNDYEHQLPGRINRARLTLHHGLAGSELLTWFQTGQYDGQVERRNISIVIFDQALSQVNSWDLPGAYPVKWSGLQFQPSGREVLVEQVELAYNGSSSGSSTGAIQASREPRIDRAATAEPAPAPQVDLDGLAAKVCELLKADLRVERERLGRLPYTCPTAGAGRR